MKNSLKFEYDKEAEEYVLLTAGIKFTCEEVEEEYYKVAVKLAALYKEKLPEIAARISCDVAGMYGKMTVDEVISKLGEPVIELDLNQIVYLDHGFDEEHIISVEYEGDLEEFTYVSIDG